MRGLLSSWQMHACTHRLYHGWFVISHGRTGALVTPLVTTPLTPCRPSLPVLPHRTRPCQHDVQCQRTAQCGGPNSAGIHPASSPAVLKEAILQWACVDAQETAVRYSLRPPVSAGTSQMAPHIKQSNRSYAEQAQSLHGCDDLNILRNAYPKPDVTATEQEATAYRLPFSQVPMVPVERPLLAAEPKTVTPAEATKSLRIIFMQRWFGFTLHHILFFTVAPMFFSWRNLVLAEIVRFVTTAIGINLCYHRLLTHHSFRCPKVVEYVCALFGAMSGQGPPVEWVSIHRYHHLHCDTPLDPHSPYEGFWWAHMGWIVNKKANVEGPLLDRANATDLTAQPFYRWLEKAWFDLMGLRILLTWWFGGWEMVCWTMTVPLVMSWHSTFFVNSASHIWGSRPYVTGDLSTNNWWVAILAYGEGWHNTHHAMPSSARHGLEWWQFDPTWLLIRGLQAVGLAWDVHLPSEKQLAAKRAPTMGLARSPSSSSRLGSFIPVARNTSVGSDVSGQEEEEAEACGKGGSPLASPARSGSIVSAAASDTSGYSGSDDEGSAHAKVE